MQLRWWPQDIVRRRAKKRHPARTSISCWREHVLQGNVSQWIGQGALLARNKLPCLIRSVLRSTNFGSRPPLRQGIVRVFRWACERQADGSLRCNHTCTSSVVSHRLYRIRSTRTVSCPSRIPIAPRLDQAGALSHRILPVQVGTLSRGLAWCALQLGWFQKRDNSLGLRDGLLVGRRRRQGVLYEARRWGRVFFLCSGSLRRRHRHMLHCIAKLHDGCRVDWSRFRSWALWLTQQQPRKRQGWCVDCEPQQHRARNEWIFFHRHHSRSANSLVFLLRITKIVKYEFDLQQHVLFSSLWHHHAAGDLHVRGWWHWK